MKLRPLLLAALGLLAAGLARADSYSFTERFSETHPFAAAGEITLGNTNGAVVIRTWDRAEVRIEGEKRAATDEELKRIGLVIDASAASLAIKTDFPRRAGGWFLFGGGTIRAEVRFTLTVPATVQLRRIDTVNGSVTIEGVRGPVTAHSVNGHVEARGLAADAALGTVNGSIHADFAALTPQQKISLETVNGSTTVGLPSDASVQIRASSVNGGVSCDFPIHLEAGNVGRTRLAGTIGEGGASLKAGTVNGSIHINRL